jgi:hypothetical protein
MKHLDDSGLVSVEEQDPAALRHFLDQVGDQLSFPVVQHRDSLARLKNPTPQSQESLHTHGLCWPILSYICMGDGDHIISVIVVMRHRYGPLDARFHLFPFGSVSRVRCVSCWITEGEG